MKVLKFGGTSIGSLEAVSNVIDIVNSQSEPTVVVVSALSGITNKLIDTAKLASDGDSSYTACVGEIRDRHLAMADSLLSGANAEKVKAELEDLLGSMSELLKGIFLLKMLPDAVLACTVSFGERLSSVIMTALLRDARRYDSLEFIKTTAEKGRDRLNYDLTYSLVRRTFSDFGKSCRVAVVPGYISTDTTTGRITNLGRGGSDFTASIIAAALDAGSLEIWTDVDGFMTADPRVIKTSYVIDRLSFVEATELCNFGAKVVYPPALYPMAKKDIPIYIRNTFNPKCPGTIITSEAPPTDRIVTGISSINNTSLLTLAGTSMVGLLGVNARIYSALADGGISVFFSSQSSSETNISLGVRDEDAANAKILLDKEFENEISEGSLEPLSVESGLATIAIVGENMRCNAGIAGKLFSTLGRNGISIISLAQGTRETNISFVVDGKYLRKSLNVIHDSFFLSEYKELNLFICGVGTVGGRLLEQISLQRENLMRERNLKLNIVGIARSSRGVFCRDGLDAASYKELLKDGIDLNPQKLRDEVIGMNIFNSVFVDCTASADVAALYADFFRNGVSVVAANKIAASSNYENYAVLKNLARKRNVKFMYETNVGAGLPIIHTMNDLVNSGDRIQKIEAVLSGTLNFIFNTLSEDVPFSRTVKMAQEAGFAEPDPRIDLSGKDVIRKLVILSREAGYKVDQEDVEANLFIPEEFFECSLDEFWAKLPSLDAKFEAERKELESKHLRRRFVACMDNGHFSVSLRTVDELHSFYVLDGSNNIVLLTTERYHEHPMLIQGYGAGADVTAAGVFADIMRIANI